MYIYYTLGRVIEFNYQLDFVAMCEINFFQGQLNLFPCNCTILRFRRKWANLTLASNISFNYDFIYGGDGLCCIIEICIAVIIV